MLNANGLTEATSPVIVQSFEVGNLKQLATMTKVRLVQLFDDVTARPYDLVKAGDPRTYKDLMAPAELTRACDLRLRHRPLEAHDPARGRQRRPASLPRP